MAMYLQRICPACAWLQMTGAHNFFRLYAPVICDTGNNMAARYSCDFHKCNSTLKIDFVYLNGEVYL